MTTLIPWAETGVLAGVIVALIGLLTWILGHQRTVHKDHQEERKNWQDSENRRVDKMETITTRWMDGEEKRTDKFVGALDNLESAIRDRNELDRLAQLQQQRNDVN